MRRLKVSVITQSDDYKTLLNSQSPEKVSRGVNVEEAKAAIGQVDGNSNLIGGLAASSASVGKISMSAVS